MSRRDSLPLLALEAGAVGAPFPDTTVTFVLQFNPRATRVVESGSGPSVSYRGSTAVLSVEPNLPVDDGVQKVIDRLKGWVCAGLVKKTGKQGRKLDNGMLEWAIPWKEFNESVARYTCTAANSPGGGRSADAINPSALVAFRQQRLDDEGAQVLTFTFAIYPDRLRALAARGRPRGRP